MKRIQDSQRNISVEIEKISNRPFYSMRYYGNDCFNEYLLRGANSLEEYCSFIDTALIHNNFGCSAFVAQNTNGDILFARNMDCEYAVPMLLRLNQDSSYSFLSLVNMAFLDWDESTYDSLEKDSKLTLAAAYSPIISEEDALDLLKNNVIPGDGQWSAVYNLTKKTLSVAFSEEYEHVYRFKMYDFDMKDTVYI